MEACWSISVDLQLLLMLAGEQADLLFPTPTDRLSCLILRYEDIFSIYLLEFYLK